MGKCQQVAGKQHLPMLIKYGLTDVTESLQNVAFEKTVESLVPFCWAINGHQVQLCFRLLARGLLSDLNAYIMHSSHTNFTLFLL